MNIGYDAKRLFNNFTGLGNYSRDIVAGMLNSYPANNYFLYTPSRSKDYDTRVSKRQTQLFDNKCTVVIPTQFPYKQFPSIWRSKGMLKNIKQDNINLYHGLSHELPIGIQHTDTKSVVTIHDVIFYLYPHLFPFIDRQIYYKKFNHACHIADRIIAISECTKRDIINIFKVDPSKIDVIYQGCNPIFALSKANEAKDPYESLKHINNHFGNPSISTPYILSVGSIEERKNLLLTVKALNELPPEISLVIVGQKTKYFEQVMQYVNDNQLSSRVHHLTNVPFTQLPILYQHASVFVYPSRYEGFGIPIIEAITSGTPVIAATGSCLEEAGGSESIYINPNNHKELAQAITLVINTPEKQQRMIEQGFKHIHQFQPDIISANIMQTYQKAINQRP